MGLFTALSVSLEQGNQPSYPSWLVWTIPVSYTHLDVYKRQINELLEGRPVDIPTYDYAEHTRSSKTYRQEPQDVFIVEGILVLEDKRLRDLMDIKIFVDTDDDVRIIRRIKRDMEERGRSLDSVIEQYLGVAVSYTHLDVYKRQVQGFS